MTEHQEKKKGTKILWMELNGEDSDDIPDVTDDRGREDKSGEPTRIRDIFVHPIHSTRQTTVAEKTSLENPRGSEASTRIPSKSTSSARWTTVLGGREDESEESTRIRDFYPDPVQSTSSTTSWLSS